MNEFVQAGETALSEYERSMETIKEENRRKRLAEAIDGDGYPD